MISERRGNDLYRPVPMGELRDFLFPQDIVSAQSLKAIPLALEDPDRTPTKLGDKPIQIYSPREVTHFGGA